MTLKFFFAYSFFIAIFSDSTASLPKCYALEGNHTSMSQFIDHLKKAEGSSQPVIVGAFKLKKASPPHPRIVEALSELVSKGTNVHILLESRLTEEEQRGPMKSYQNALALFEDTGAILMKDMPPFKNVHIKVVVADHFALLGTTNFDDEPENSLKRDFCILTSEKKIIDELRTTLYALERNEKVEWPSYLVKDLKEEETRLSWGPSQHRAHFLELIEQALETIYIYQQDIQDETLVQTLEKKLTQGIKVVILMSKYPFSQKNGNQSLPSLRALAHAKAKIYLTGDKKIKDQLPLHIHAKVLLIDAGTANQKMYLGSANFYPPVLDPQGNNLNVGIITRAKDYIQNVHKIFLEDWSAHADHLFNPFYS